MKIKTLNDVQKVLKEAEQENMELYKYMLYLLFQRKEDINIKLKTK